MKNSGNRVLMVCAAALLASVSGAALAQEAQAVEGQMMEKATTPPKEEAVVSAPTAPASLSAPAAPEVSPETAPPVSEPVVAEDKLPVPTGKASADPLDTFLDLPEPKTAPVPAPKPPEPVLSATSPETNAVREASPSSPADPAAVARIVTLRDAVAVGVLTNPGTEAVENNRRATDEELKQAKALWMPSVDLSANTGYESIHSNPDDAADGHSDLWGAQGSLTLTQMLFDGFSTKYENKRQVHRVRSAAHRVREHAEFYGLDIVEAYLDVLRQRELYAISVENVHQHEQILGQISDGEQAGRSTGADVEQTKARLASARTQEAAVLQALQTAEASFRRRVGDKAQPDLQIPTAPKQFLEATVEDEVKQALTHSPTLDIKEADVNVAEAESKGSASTLYPKVDFQLNGTSGLNQDGVEGDTSEASAKVVANWNLYRGGGDKARTREFVYRHAQAKNERNDVARSIENDVRQTWANMTAAATKAMEFRKQADANAMVVQAYKDQFNLDRRTLLDVLDSQNEWFVSRSNAINNGYLDVFATYRLLALKGVLLPSLEIAYPKEVNPADKS
ncbi:MAG: TolC family outer membrane protein [Alphaproteobacteria bacterium]|jgi:adhesin transport system outer membrane protein|nr:TolC family outer membrane protein [Alphaproteobacteria bacterium]MBP9868344.1 TolC family outer membrane protein [Alphaproteobacteria bacterium]